MHTLPVVHVAIADDHPLTVAGNTIIVNSFDKCRVTIQAYDGTSLLQQLQDAELPVHICLLDVNMPGLNGLQVLQQVRQRWPGIRVIMLSMYYDDFNIITAFRHGAAAYLSKDTTPQQLQQAFAEVISHGTHFNNWIARNIMPRLHDKGNLTDTDIAMLKLCCTDMTCKEMADVLRKSQRTIDDYRDRLFTKLNIHSRVGLALYAINSGIVPLGTMPGTPVLK